MTSLPIVLPNGFHPTITVSDTVTAGQVIAKSEQAVEEIIPLANLLGVSARAAGKYIKKQPGSPVEIGDTLAEIKSFLSHTEVKSQVSGIVDRYERNSGTLIIKPAHSDSQGESLTAPVDGKVLECTETKITIQTDKSVLLGTHGVGESAQSELLCLDEAGSVDGFYTLDTRAIGKIVLLLTASKDTVMKATGIGVTGLIVKDISAEDIAYVQSRGNTFPLVQVEQNVYDILCKQKNRSVFISGKEKVIILIA